MCFIPVRQTSAAKKRSTGLLPRRVARLSRRWPIILESDQCEKQPKNSFKNEKLFCNIDKGYRGFLKKLRIFKPYITELRQAFLWITACDYKILSALTKCTILFQKGYQVIIKVIILQKIVGWHVYFTVIFLRFNDVLFDWFYLHNEFERVKDKHASLVGQVSLEMCILKQ